MREASEVGEAREARPVKEIIRWKEKQEGREAERDRLRRIKASHRYAEADRGKGKQMQEIQKRQPGVNGGDRQE